MIQQIKSRCVGMGQILVESGEPAANLERADRMIREAAAKACEVIVLPECLDLGWSFPGARTMAQSIPGPYSDALAAAAREARIFVVAGLTERAGERLYNAAVLISPDGEILRKHRKINELDIALDLYSVGDTLAVAHTRLGVIGINICADNFPDALDLGTALAHMGAQILLSPSAWAVEADHDNTATPYGDLWMESYSVLARRHRMTVIGVSNVGWIRGGPWNGRKCIGCSLAIGPDAEVLAKGPYGEEAQALVVVTVPVGRQVSTHS